MKRLLALMVTVLGLAFAGTLPDTPRFSTPITIQTGPAGDPLEVVLSAAAQSVGLTPVLRDVPDVNVRLALVNKPFRQVWNLLIATYGEGKLDFQLLENDVILVAPTEVIARLRTQESPEAEPQEEPVLRRFYPVPTGDPKQIADFLEQEISGLSVSVVPGQNVLVVRGTEAQQVEVQTLLSQLQKPAETPPLLQRTFQLSYAKAGELAKVLTEALGAQDVIDRLAGLENVDVSLTPPEDGSATKPINIVADERTNTLIVTGTAEQIAVVEALIPKLDKPVQQVQLKVRVQEVDSQVFNNLGLKWDSLSGGNLIASVLDNGLNLIFDATRSLASLNIVATLDALEKQNLARRVSDANLIIEDNFGASDEDLRQTGAKGAELKAGAKLLLPIRIGGEIEVREFDVGLTLRLRPQITADRQILLEVFTQTGGDPQSGPEGSILIPQKSTLSKLRIKDGQTVVLGGLIERTVNKSENKVPLLGDIPILGMLFRQTSNEVRDTELLVVITANIVDNAPSAEASP